MKAKPLGPRILLFLMLGLTPVTGLKAQSASLGDRLSVDVGLGFLGSIPDEFESKPCGSLFGISGVMGVGLELTSKLFIESSLSVSALRPATCDIDEVLPPTDGSSTRRAFPGGTAGNPFFMTSHRVVLDPRPPTSAGPRASIGIGRFWGKGAWFWSVGLGFRIPFGRTSTRVEVERLGFNLGFSEVTTVWSGGEVVRVYTSPEKELEESMWALRVRIPVFR